MKSALLLLSLVLVSTVLSQDCNNPLLQAYNLNSTGQPQSGQGFQWCSNLQNGQSCCSSDTVNQLQGLLQNLVNSLESQAGTRDENYVNLRYNVLDNYQNAVSDLTDDELNDIQNANQAVGTELRNEYNFFNRNSDQLSDIDDEDNQNQDGPTGHNDFFWYLQNLQVARNTCWNTVIDVQASLWCLACDANYANQGVNSDGTVTLSNDLVNRVTNACYNYTTWSQNFNPLIIANQTIQRVRDLGAFLRNYGNDNNVLNTGSIAGVAYQPTLATERTVTLPPDCVNENNCANQVRYVLAGGVVNQDIAANGAGWLGGADVVLPDINQGSVSQVNNVNTNWADSNNNITINPQGGAGGAAFNPVGNLSGIPINLNSDPGQVSGLSDGVNAGPRGAAANGWISNLQTDSDDD